jgi:hypothetical protein
MAIARLETARLRHVLSLAGITLGLLLLVTPNLSGESHARIVRLSDIEGSVQLDRDAGEGFERAIMNMPVAQGMKLETGASGRAEVEFENGTVLRLADNSSVEFENLSLTDDGKRATVVRVNGGVVYVNFKHKDGGNFRLDLGTQAINLDHDAHFRVRLLSDAGGGDIAVFKGELQVPENGESAKLKKDQTFNLNFNDSSQQLMAKGISNFDSDQWDSERDAYATQYAANYNKSQYPYQYGYSDLNYYGSFSNAGGYGTLWRPFGVNALWDPFGDGAWAYYPGFGYTWVSGYPWGWTPYRYGSWVYVPTYGWGWRPGGWNTWNSSPVVVNAPGTWRRPLPPLRGPVTRTVIVGHPEFTRPARTFDRGAFYRGSPNRGVGFAPGRTAPPASTTNAGRPSRGAAPAPGARPAPHSSPSPGNRPAPSPRSASPRSSPSFGSPHSSGGSSAPRASAPAARPSRN